MLVIVFQCWYSHAELSFLFYYNKDDNIHKSKALKIEVIHMDIKFSKKFGFETVSNPDFLKN